MATVIAMDLMTTKEVAHFLYLSEHSVRQMLKRGELQGMRGKGGRYKPWRVYRSSVELWAKENSNELKEKTKSE